MCSKWRASRAGSAVTTCNSGHRACDSRRRSPRRTPAARAAAEHAMTRLASVTAIGHGRGQTGSCRRGDGGPVHAPERQHSGAGHLSRLTHGRVPKGRPARPHGQPHPADPPTSRGGRSAAGADDLVAADMRVQPGGGSLPVPVRDEQRAPPLPGTCDHRPGARCRHRPTAEAEDHQIHSVHQDRSHFDRVGSRFGDDRDPAQVRSHLHGGEQPDIWLADDRDVTALCRHRSHHAQLQRPGTRKHRYGSPGQRAGKQLSHRIWHRQQRTMSLAGARGTAVPPGGFHPPFLPSSRTPWPSACAAVPPVQRGATDVRRRSLPLPQQPLPHHLNQTLCSKLCSNLSKHLGTDSVNQGHRHPADIETAPARASLRLPRRRRSMNTAYDRRTLEW